MPQKNNLVYVSGSITGASPAELEMFHEADRELRLAGYRVFNPLTLDIPEANTDQDAWTRALCRDIAVIVSPRCMGICVLPTFKRSKGALIECFVAFSMKRELVLLDMQHESWRDQVLMDIRAAQATLWQHVDIAKYPHHSDIAKRPFLPELDEAYGVQGS
jgi:hypothetical protein